MSHQPQLPPKPRWKRWRDSDNTSRFLTYAWDSQRSRSIPKLLADAPDLMVVIMTAYAFIDSAVEAIKRGAADYIAKPFTPSQIRHLVNISHPKGSHSAGSRSEGALSQAAPDIDFESGSPRFAPSSMSPPKPRLRMLRFSCAAKAAPARLSWPA